MTTSDPRPDPIAFTPFPKIARLNRTITITEKLDGTNAAVVIVKRPGKPGFNSGDVPGYAVAGGHDIDTGEETIIFAQSRSRFIVPQDDNYGFANWVQRNAGALIEVLDEGTHFGEWWGGGIQRGYGLAKNDKRFSLFNTTRWLKDGEQPLAFDEVPGLGVVPVLYEGPFDQEAIWDALSDLNNHGSQAAPGFFKAEGVVVFHHAANALYKVTLEGDEAPKGEATHALDEERIAA